MSFNQKKDRRGEQINLVDLLSAAKSGDQSASAGLLLRYEPLIESLTARFRSESMTEQDVEELRQDARVEFFKALDSYDTECDGVEFGLYAKICISNALTSSVRRFNVRQKHIPIIYGDDELLTLMPSDEKNALEAIIASENYIALCRAVTNVLSNYENSIWWMYVSGKKTGEIAKVLGRDERSVANAIYRIRKKLRDFLGDFQK